MSLYRKAKPGELVDTKVETAVETKVETSLPKIAPKLMVETGNCHGKHKDADAHRLKMREHMRKKRAKA